MSVPKRLPKTPSLGQAIFVRFVILLSLSFAPLFIGILYTMEYGFRSYVYAGDIRKAHEFASLLESDYSATGSWKKVQPFLTRPPFGYQTEQTSPGYRLIQERVVVLDNSRRVVLDSKHVLLGTVHPPEHLTNAVRLFDKQKKPLGYLLIGTMIDPALTINHQAFLADMAVILLILFLASLAVSLPLAFWLGSRISRPLKILVKETQQAATGHWTWSVPSSSPREIQTLAQEFQRLGFSLKASETRQNELIADAAHELRTPLTVIRGTLEAMIDGVFPLEKRTLENVYSETQRLEKIVESLRQLQDLRTTRVKPTPFMWRTLIDQVVGLFQASALENHQTILIRCAEKIQGWGESEGVIQVLINLLSNALRYTPKGGTVTVEISAVYRGTQLSVEDSGPGIPFQEREHIFERFVRLDPSRSEKTGARGLGLAIAREIILRHSGSIRVTEAPRGGARFEVTFPSAQLNSFS
ncbi:MAG: HAMP domain-containing histidine kinase [Spirochaetales bacterium]|nr:HAMP domain-containing histidine kinase [Spirochaetales bacterium]